MRSASSTRRGPSLSAGYIVSGLIVRFEGQL